MPLQIRRGTEAERQALVEKPAQGELIWITDQRKLYIGNGQDQLKDLVPVTGFDDDDALEAVGRALTTGSYTNISFTYNDGPGTIDASVDLSQYTGNIEVTGNITAAGIVGTILAEDSGLLVDATDGTINLNGTVRGNIIPDQNEQYDIGSVDNRFRDLYLSGSSIELGNASITASGSVVNLPAGSTIGGAPIGEAVETVGEGVVEGSNYNINIIGDDSSIILDSSQNILSIATIESPTQSLVVNSFGEDAIVSSAVRNAGPGSLPHYTLDVSNGTVDVPTDTAGNEFLGGFRVRGYYDGSYLLSGAMLSSWGSSPDFSKRYPESTLTFVVGNNTDADPTNFAQLDNTGKFSAKSFQTGSYNNDAERDAEITSPVAGMIIFNLRDDSTGVPVFQGYDGSNWVDFH